MAVVDHRSSRRVSSQESAVETNLSPESLYESETDDDSQLTTVAYPKIDNGENEVQ